MTRILIAGAGIGGLALAQALRHGGFDVAVYERDPTPETRDQGYRIHIDANGNTALRACLPPGVLAEVRRTSARNGDLVAGYTQQLERVTVQVFPAIPTDDITHVDRATFRRSLATGLVDTVHFGRTVTGYEITGGRVRVRFAEGGEDEGDLLVGADGAGSAVRAQLLPYATVRDLGLRCLYGRMPVDETTEPLIPEDFHRGFCWVAGDNGYGAGFAPVRFRSPSAETPDYLMTTLVARSENLGRDASPEELKQIAVKATSGWHSTVRQLFEYADAGSFFPITIRASLPVEAWNPGPVTLLGDAIHTMPPTGGVGANTALQDAATLSAELLGGKSLIEAVAAYERVMLPRGFATVEQSLRMADRMFPS